MPILKRMYDWLHPKPEEPPTTTAEMQALADNAVQRAISDLHDAKSRGQKVSDLVSKSDSQLERNHFGELAALSMSRRG